MVLPPLQAFLLPSPHQPDLQMEQGPAQQHRRLSELLQSTVFPEFVSAPALHISLSSPTSARAQWGLAARSCGHPGALAVPPSPAQQAEPAAVTGSICSPWHTEGADPGEKGGQGRDRAGAELLSPPGAGMSCSVSLCLQGDGEDTRTPQGRGRAPQNGLWAGVWGETQLRLL